MTSETTIKFRENAITAVSRDADGLTVAVRGTTGNRPPLRLIFANLSTAVQDEGFGYGMEVRVTRLAALERNEKTGKAASPDEKYDAIKRGVDWYNSGTESWTLPSSGGGGGLSADTRVLIEALCRALGLTEVVAEEQVRGMTSAERDALRGDAEIKPFLDAVYAERAKAAGADVAGLKERLRKGV